MSDAAAPPAPVSPKHQKDKKEKKDKREKKVAAGDEAAAAATASTHETSAAVLARLPPVDSTAEENYDANRDAVEMLCRQGMNSICADCNAQGTRWASVNHGVFVCIRCSGVHRSLGAHISKVKSTNLDKWTASEIRVMAMIGNARQQELYEVRLPRGTKKPDPADSDAIVRSYITQKYADKSFSAENLNDQLKRVFKQSGYKLGRKALKDATGDKAASGSAAGASGGLDFGGGKNDKPRKAKQIFGAFGQVTVSAEEHDSLRRAMLATFGISEEEAAA